MPEAPCPACGGTRVEVLRSDEYCPDLDILYCPDCEAQGQRVSIDDPAYDCDRDCENCSKFRRSH